MINTIFYQVINLYYLASFTCICVCVCVCVCHEYHRIICVCVCVCKNGGYIL